jgi:hypothetical protein
VVNGETRAAFQPSVGQSQPHSRYLRPALAGLLLLAAIAGVGAASTGAGGPWSSYPLAIGVAAELLLAVLLLAVAMLARHSPMPGHLRSQLRYLLRWGTIVLMIAIAVIVFINYLATRHRSTLLKLLSPKTQKRPRQERTLVRPHPVHTLHLSYLLYALIALLLVVAIAACVLVVVRRKPAWPAFADELAEEEGASLQRAVESGRAALRAVDDARAAIIACYLAMEGSLATAGTARAAAETPDELLARATASGLLHGPAAARLTALFYEARFSTHPLSGTAKADATTALDEISAELRVTAGTGGTTSGRGPASTGPASTGPVGGAPQ